MKYIFAGIIGLGVACGSGLTQVERDELLEHAHKLENCRAIGRDAGSYQAYEQCKADAGIR